MDKQPKILDPIWEAKYAAGHAEKYPWDMVVTFVFRNAPRDRPRSEVHIMEVGFGTAPNLCFAAEEGFKVSGVEGSPSAVAFAESRFKSKGLSGNLQVGDFTKLPFDNDSFDLVIDRGSLVCVGSKAQKQAVSEVHRCLRRGGRFLHNAYSDSHSSFRAGNLGLDGLIDNITGGSLVGVGKLHFSSRSELNERFSKGWKLLQVQRREWVDMLNVSGDIHSEWVVIAEKI
jgi:SAM-dependent methyltransferase